MKIVVVSDSHGNKQAINNIFSSYTFDYFVFLGDGISDLGTYAYLPNVYIVKGNCDFFDNYPTEICLDFDGVHIFATHGHKYGAKHTLGLLTSRAVEQNASIVLYGHTHIFEDTFLDGIRLINPGSLGRSRDKNSSFVLLEINNGEVVVKHINL